MDGTVCCYYYDYYVATIMTKAKTLRASGLALVQPLGRDGGERITITITITITFTNTFTITISYNYNCY